MRYDEYRHLFPVQAPLPALPPLKEQCDAIVERSERMQLSGLMQKKSFINFNDACKRLKVFYGFVGPEIDAASQKAAYAARNATASGSRLLIVKLFGNTGP